MVGLGQPVPLENPGGSEEVTEAQGGDVILVFFVCGDDREGRDA